MFDLCTRSPLALPLLLTGLLVSGTAFAADTGPGVDANKTMSDHCAAQTWPNISADCAGMKATRKIRVISLDGQTSSTIQAPASVPVVYASKPAEAKAASHEAKTDGRTAVLQDVAPMPKLTPEGADVAADDSAASVAPAEVVTEPVAAAPPRRARPRKAAKVQKSHRSRYAADYAEPYASYTGDYGRDVARQPSWNGQRGGGSAGWFNGGY